MKGNRMSSSAISGPTGRRLAFLGAAAMQGAGKQLCEQIGRLLAERSLFRIATSGFKGRSRRDRSFAYYVAHGFAAALSSEAVLQRVTTYVAPGPDGSYAYDLFQLGICTPPRGQSDLSRQVFIVTQSDLLCLAGGGAGISQCATLALWTDKPVLPLPFFGGSASEFWREHQALIQTSFDLPDDRWQRWSNLAIADLTLVEISQLADEVVTTLLGGANGTCVVCMPFADDLKPLYNDLLLPAITSAHFQPQRMDRSPVIGDITVALRQELENCNCVVAVLDGRNPNVMYEVGFAHALNKPVILLQGKSSLAAKLPELPFDIRTHRVIYFPTPLEPLGTQQALAELHDVLRAIARTNF